MAHFNIGEQYEFSDYESFERCEIGTLQKIYEDDSYRSKCGTKSETFNFIRPLTVEAATPKVADVDKPLSGFVNVFVRSGSKFTDSYDTKKQADMHNIAGCERVLCIDLSQHNEGEGL